MKTLETVVAAAAALLAFGGAALAQGYPTKLIVFYGVAPGGPPEAIQRAVFIKIKENTGATLLWEARPGGGGAVALKALKGAAADGYTMAPMRARSTSIRSSTRRSGSNR